MFVNLDETYDIEIQESLWVILYTNTYKHVETHIWQNSPEEIMA